MVPRLWAERRHPTVVLGYTKAPITFANEVSQTCNFQLTMVRGYEQKENTVLLFLHYTKVPITFANKVSQT